MDHVDELPQEYLNFLDAGEKSLRVVCDYIAGMSDIYAIDQFENYLFQNAERILKQGQCFCARYYFNRREKKHVLSG